MLLVPLYLLLTYRIVDIHQTRYLPNLALNILAINKRVMFYLRRSAQRLLLPSQAVNRDLYF